MRRSEQKPISKSQRALDPPLGLRWVLVILIALFNLLGPVAAYAHESRPAYLEINQISGDSYAILWKKPARQNRGLALSPRFPASCRDITSPVTHLAPGAFIERRTLRCPEGLMNQTIMIDGLSTTLTDVLVRIELMDGITQTNVLKPSNPSMTVQGARPAHEIAGEYLVLGIEHILLGIDHMLFGELRCQEQYAQSNHRFHRRLRDMNKSEGGHGQGNTVGDSEGGDGFDQ